MTKGKNIVIAISGGIAAYKCPELCRLFIKDGANVQVLLTKSARHFVSPLVLSSLSGRSIPADDLGQTMEHINIARWSDMIVFVPATSNIIAKLAHGIADDFITTVALATTSPIACCPAMNVNMYNNPATQHNLEILKSRSIQIWGPDVGYQACGEYGPGRMIDPLDILNHSKKLFEVPVELSQCKQFYKNKKIVITAGPTREFLDPVRFMSNKSSGKMGYSLAIAAAKCMANVILISGPCNSKTPINLSIKLISVITAKEMYEQVMKNIIDSYLFIGCAAVCDYRPLIYSQDKIKKSDELTVQFEKNPDIISQVAANIRRPEVVVGFAAETSKLEENARIKLQNKKIDMICANDVSIESKGGFDSDFNEVVILWSEGKTTVSGDKQEVAYKILDSIMKSRKSNN